MVKIRLFVGCVLVSIFGTVGCDLEQYNPRPTWEREEQERLNAKKLPPQLNEDGTLPDGIDKD